MSRRIDSGSVITGSITLGLFVMVITAYCLGLDEFLLPYAKPSLNCPSAVEHTVSGDEQ